MGEPMKIGGKAKRYPKIADKGVFDAHMTDAALGTHHKNGLSSQNGRTTIIYRDGKRVVVRANGEVLLPNEVRATRRMKMSMYNLLEKNDAITMA